MGFSKSWTIGLNQGNQSQVIDVSLPGGVNRKYLLKAWAGGNSVGENILLFSGGLVLAEALNRIEAGFIDALMVVPRGGVGEVRTSGDTRFTVLSDIAIGAGINVLVTVRLVEIP